MPSAREPAPEVVTPVDPPILSCELSAARVTYSVEGLARGPGVPELILVHGIPGGVRDYRYLAPLLGQWARVYRFELPGFGANVHARLPDPAPRTRAECVLQFADALGIDGFSIVGHSMGGRTAVEVAAKAPARVRGLVCLASVGIRRHRGYVSAPWVLRALDTLVRAPLLRPALIRVVRRGYARAGFRGDYSEEELVHHMQHVSAIDFAGARRAAARVRSPTLVCAADDDRLIEPVIADELADAIAGGRVLHFESGGHNIQKTRALAIATAIRVLLAA